MVAAILDIISRNPPPKKLWWKLVLQAAGIKKRTTDYDRPSISCTQLMIDHENPSRFLSLVLTRSYRTAVCTWWSRGAERWAPCPADWWPPQAAPSGTTPARSHACCSHDLREQQNNRWRGWSWKSNIFFFFFLILNHFYFLEKSYMYLKSFKNVKHAKSEILLMKVKRVLEFTYKWEICWKGIWNFVFRNFFCHIAVKS